MEKGDSTVLALIQVQGGGYSHTEKDGFSIQTNLTSTTGNTCALTADDVTTTAAVTK